MTDNELLLSFSNIVDIKIKENLKPIKEDIINIKEDITNMKTDITNMKSDITNMKVDIINIKTDIINLQDELHILKVDLIENDAIPRLNNIEKHYVSTANRYINSIELQESMKVDVELMKNVIQDHSEKLQKIS